MFVVILNAIVVVYGTYRGSMNSYSGTIFGFSVIYFVCEFRSITSNILSQLNQLNKLNNMS